MAGVYFWPKESPAPTPQALQPKDTPTSTEAIQQKPAGPSPFVPNTAIEETIKKLETLPTLVEFYYPPRGSEFTVRNGVVQLKMTIRLEMDDRIPVNILIYNNDPKAYQEFKPYAFRNDYLPSITQPFKIAIAETFILQPGLHYILVESAEEKEILGIDRIQIIDGGQ